MVEELEVAVVIGQLDLGKAESGESRAVAEGCWVDCLDRVPVEIHTLQFRVANQSADPSDFVGAQVEVSEVHEEEADVGHARLLNHVSFKTELFELLETAKACYTRDSVSVECERS